MLGRDAKGNYAVTEPQSRAQFSMWAVLAAPMILSQNIRNLSAFQLSTYLNSEVIGVGQDIRGRQGQRLAGGPLSTSGMYPIGADAAAKKGWKPPTRAELKMRGRRAGYTSRASQAPVTLQVCSSVAQPDGRVLAPTCVTMLHANYCQVLSDLILAGLSSGNGT